MALTPIITTSLSENNLTITDDTVYGLGGESARVDVGVSFGVNRIIGSGPVAVTLPAYDVDTVTSILLEDLVDGHYQITMTIDDRPNSVEETAQANVLVYFSLTTCLNEKRVEWGCACCKSGSALEDTLFKLDAVVSAIGYAESVSNFADAQCIIERAQPLCDDPCGCCSDCQ